MSILRWGSQCLCLRDGGQPFAVIALVNPHGAPAIGGVRIIEGGWQNHAMSLAMDLADTMQQKAHALGLPLGGAKAVMYIPNPNDRPRLLARFAQALNDLQGQYITAVDMGSGVADMNFLKQRSPYVTCYGEVGTGPSPYTAQTVIAGIEAALMHLYGSMDLNDRHIVIQGMGKVGQSIVLQLQQLYPGITFSVTDILSAKALGMTLGPKIKWVNPDAIFDVTGDVFVACAGAYGVTAAVANRLNCPILAAAANQPLASKAVAGLLQQRGILMLSDYIINGGGLLYCAKQYGFISQCESYIAMVRSQVMNALSMMYMQSVA